MPLWSPLLQQDPRINALCHTLEEECLPMLNSLENHPLVLEVPEEVGQKIIWGVEGQLREEGDGRTLVMEEGFGRFAWQRRPRRERWSGRVGERDGASESFLWNGRRGHIGEKSDLVSGGTWASEEVVRSQ